MKGIFAAVFCAGVMACTSAPKDVGLVLSGGGAKGAYEIGVWKALRETGVAERIQVFSGSSVGAINATLFASIGDADECVRLWQEAVGKVFTCNTNELQKSIQQPFDDYETVRRDFLKGKKPGEELTPAEKFSAGMLVGLSALFRMAERVDNSMQGASNSVGVCNSSQFREVLKGSLPARWSSRPPYVYVTAVAKETGGVRLFLLNGNERERVIDCLMASTAIPVIFDSVRIDGVEYVDGGFEARGGDNVPVRPIRESHPEVKTIIVVHLGDGRGRARRIGADSTGVKVIEIFPSRSIGGGLGGLEGTFALSQETIGELVDLGYRDAMRVLQGERVNFDY